MKFFYKTILFNWAFHFFKTFRWLFCVVIFLASKHSFAQTTPTNICNFLSKKGGITSVNGAEIPAFDPLSNRVYVVAGPVVEIYSLNSSGSLALTGSLPIGFQLAQNTMAIPNSVAVKNGVLAASFAIVNTINNAQLPGRVSFYNSVTGASMSSVQVGYLPDMVTFTPDGKKLLTANEGEPNSYSQAASFDPEGSVSIIDLSGGATNASVQTASFASFNGQIASLRTAGVRIYGPGATVAQDLEPEYISVSPDGAKAWVTLQENNAFAIVDIATATVESIKALGLKNHSQPTVTGLQNFVFDNLPPLGTTAAGQSIPLGGFSGLHFEGYAANGSLKFVTHTDRGPNGEPTGINRPFLLPAFTPEIIRFELNRSTSALTITQRIQLKNTSLAPLTGLPNTAISSNANDTYNDEVPVDLKGNVISPLDKLGADLEGIVVAENGSFWMVDEYRPAIYHFNTQGELIDRFVPAGTAAAAGQSVGSFGTETLPAVLAQRRQNRGFEAIAYQNGKIYAFVQSPIRNPASLSNAVLNGLQNIRVIEFDPTTKTTTRQFIYIMDNTPAVAGSTTDTRADKIGDAVAVGNGEFLVLERDDDAIDSDPINQIEKKVYRFSLAGATDITAFPNVINGKTLDQMSRAELTAAGVSPITKYLHIDLPSSGYNTVEKIEGLTIIDRNTVAVINDNDFTVAGITIDQATGTFTPDPNAETPVLGLISLRNNGLDASDRDLASNAGKINIQHWPVYGMYQPDAIATFNVAGQNYFITANEGDARDYPGFAEEIRVGASGYVLDPLKFPNASVLKQNANLGRLQLTNATGNVDGDGDFDQIQALGARSFSIWNSSGELVYDSGDELEQITAASTPELFNSDGSAATFDTRSDNKGPEPEGVAIGIIDNVPYAFIGLERTGDVIVYNVSNPLKPVFVQYINLPEDMGVEGLIFVEASSSPTDKPLLITTAEVSKTITVYEVNIPTIVVSENAGLQNNDGVICKGSEVTLTALGDGPYLWSTGATTKTITVSPNETATYSVSTCGLTGSQTITVNPVPTCSIVAVPENSIFTGGVPTNIYLGYGPQKLTLNVSVPDNGAPYTYKWSGGILSNSNSANPVFAATKAGVYTFTVQVTNVYGCSSTCSITISVTDIIEPGSNGKKAFICHNGHTQSVNLNALSAHLQNHSEDRLGTCNETSNGKYDVAVDRFDVKALSNPAKSSFTIQVQSIINQPVQIRVLDLNGRYLLTKQTPPSSIISFGDELIDGTYIVEVTQGQNKKVLKLIKY